MKKWYFQLAGLVVSGLILLSLNVDAIRSLRDASSSELFHWLNITELGVGSNYGAILVLLLMLIADAVWILIVISWSIKKVFRIEDKDNTLHLP